MSDTESAQSTQKLSKKQLKALRFKAKTSNNAAEELKAVEESKEREIEETKKRKHDEEEAAEAAAAAAEAAPKKKRKTRRGKKHRGEREGDNSGPRFILFVGNLPYKITEEDIMTHFKNCKPSSVRLRTDKGCAFIEYKNEDLKESKRQMDIALRLHKSVLGGRKINVELTAGGGGNSQDRKEKIKAKNEKLEDERMKRTIAEREKKSKAEAKKEQENDDGSSAVPEGGVHPDRAKLLQQE